MIKVETTRIMAIVSAMRNMKAKGYRKVNNNYEAFASDQGKSINLGTYKTEDEAKEAVVKYRLHRFNTSCENMGLSAKDGVVFENNYIAFPSGQILNLHGSEIKGCVGRDGYRHVIINGKNIDVHRIIARLFVPNRKDKEQVNHIDGCKTNNSASNLEWCTRSENLKHAYQIGLERKVCGEKHHAHKLTYEDAKYIKQNAKPRDKACGFAALSRRFGVDRTTIADVYKGVTWREA